MKTAIPRFLGGFALALLACFSGRSGAEAADRAASGPAGNGSVKSATILVEGYQDKVTVNASPEELYAFLAKPNNLTYRSVKFGETVFAAGQNRFGPGASYRFRYQKAVVVIPGRMIALRTDPDHIWFIRDFSERNLQQWQLTPGPEGTQVTLRWTSEVPDTWWVDAFQWLAPPSYWHKSTDLMLAGIQAHFDPSEKPKQLVKHGLRGEGYETVLQMHRTSVEIAASPAEVERYLNHPDRQYLDWGRAENDCLAEPLPLDRVLYCRSTLDQEGRELAVESFGIDHEQGRGFCRRYYQVALGLVGMLEMRVEPKSRGTELKLRWEWEMPDPLSPQSMDQTLFLFTLPTRLQATALQIREGVEAGR